MEELLKCIKERMAIIKKAIAKAEKESGSFPEGRLRVSKNGKQVRYYQVLKQSDTIGEYIKKANMALVGKLAQKDYHDHFLRDAYEELKRLEKLFSLLSSETADQTYDDISQRRTCLLKLGLQNRSEQTRICRKRRFMIHDEGRRSVLNPRRSSRICSMIWGSRIVTKKWCS